MAGLKIARDDAMAVVVLVGRGVAGHARGGGQRSRRREGKN